MNSFYWKILFILIASIAINAYFFINEDNYDRHELLYGLITILLLLSWIASSLCIFILYLYMSKKAKTNRIVKYLMLSFLSTCGLAVLVLSINFFYNDIYISTNLKYNEYLKIKKETESKGKLACVVCGYEGKTVEYRRIGAYSPNNYHGPYIYCTQHTYNSPEKPIEKIDWSYYFSFILMLCGMLYLIILLTSPFRS